jgi:CRP-like cAMP-binding protein
MSARGVPDKLWYLRRLNLFDGMTVEEVERVSHDLRMRSCSAKSSVLDGSTERVYMVKHGRVRLYHITQNGQEVTTAVLVPGQLFGLGALFGKGGDATFAEALEDSVICDAAAQDFISMMARHPILMAKVMMAMARQMIRLESTIESIVSRPVAGRLGDLLITLAEETERNPDGAIVLPAYSHEELGKMIGATRESVSRTLGDWRRAGIISTHSRRIVVRNPAALRSLAAGHDAPRGGRAGQTWNRIEGDDGNKG